MQSTKTHHVATDGVAWSICRSVYLLITIVIPAKTVKPTEVPHGVWSRAPQGTTYQMETQILMEGTVLRAVDLLNNQSGSQGAARGDAASRYR